MKSKFSILAALLISITLPACVQVQSEVKRENKQLAISSVRDAPLTYAKGSTFSLLPHYAKQSSLNAKQTQTVYAYRFRDVVYLRHHKLFDQRNLIGG